jgi:hypothetical protein
MDPEAMPASELDGLRAEVSAIRGSLFEAWKIYMNWYTWFFGANLLVLGWLFTAAKPPSELNMRLIGGAWIFFNSIGTVTSLRIRTYTLEASAGINSLTSLLNQTSGWSFKVTSNLSFPERLGALAALFNALALSVNIALWIYIVA